MLYRWMVFCPEWLTGNPNLDTSDVLNFWVNLVVRVAPSPPLLFRPLKHPPLVYEHGLGLGSSLAHVELLPRSCRVVTLSS